MDAQTIAIAAGVLGFVTGMITVSRYLANMEKPDPLISLFGMGEALHNVALALLLMMVAIIATSIGTFRQSRLATA